ncbi:hypothetical protein OC846_003185 [Tilletia horrida]|uniref:Protein kinase domain-containing protein n=1 Tax=Tilletia horrida TaxID=155126 RepID=A0AAN6GSX8_9BASI|nr:hypothetical protein OC846_003185 [Tilletia horrida]KAK0569692.1 hypothetical protein OC861_000654 [Tilletia horrida]
MSNRASAAALSGSSALEPGQQQSGRAKRKRLVPRKKTAGSTNAVAPTRRGHATSGSVGSFTFSPMRTRAGVVANPRDQHAFSHSSPVIPRRSRGDLLKPSPKARKLDHAPPSSAEWSTGSENEESDSSFSPSPTMSPRRPLAPRQYNTRRHHFQRAKPDPKGKRKAAVPPVTDLGPPSPQPKTEPASEDSGKVSSAGTDEETSTDDYLLRKASSKQLNRLLKADLIRVHLMTGIWDDEQSMDPDLYTKDELIGGVMHWREHLDTTRGTAEEEKNDVRSTASSSLTEMSDEDGGQTPRASSSGTTRLGARQYRRSARNMSESQDGDITLLSRTDSSVVHSYKPPTPQLEADDAEGRPAEAVDELNGLDLEGLNLTDKEIHPSKLEKLEKIGSGGFKDVYVGKYHISKTRSSKVAIADIRDQLTEMDIKELGLLRDLKHENIVRFIGVSIPEEPKGVPVMIVTELCSNGDLFDYIRNTEAPADEEVFRILLETARGLEYLHTRKPAIIHRDCKSTNVLITRNRTAKINDFGLARVKNSTRSVVRSLVGTVNWQAAELWVPKPHYNEKVDVWSAAMTFWEALQWHQSEKKYPFQDMNQHQIYLDVGQKRLRPKTGFIRRQYGGEIVELLDRMWHHTPRERPTMTEVCEELELLIAKKRSVAAPKRSR